MAPSVFSVTDGWPSVSFPASWSELARKAAVAEIALAVARLDSAVSRPTIAGLDLTSVAAAPDATVADLSAWGCTNLFVAWPQRPESERGALR